MQTSRDDYVQHFASLSDEALLGVKRGELVEVAQTCLDEEVARRGIHPASAEPVTETASATEVPPEKGPQMVVVAEYQDPGEAELARDLLRSAGIEAMLMNERLANMLNIPMSPGTFHLLAPAESEEEALQILTSEISDEELAAQAEAAAGEPQQEN